MGRYVMASIRTPFAHKAERKMTLQYQVSTIESCYSCILVEEGFLLHHQFSS